MVIRPEPGLGQVRELRSVLRPATPGGAPSTDKEQVVHIEIPYPGGEPDLHQWMRLVKRLLVLPRVVAIAFQCAAAVVCWVIAWFAIWLSGRYPQGLFDIVFGVIRWTLRVDAYSVLLVTDQNPPFRLEE